MSFKMQWEKFDAAVAANLKDFLNSHLQSLALPAFIGPVTITHLLFGSAPPDLVLRNLTDPLPGTAFFLLSFIH